MADGDRGATGQGVVQLSEVDRRALTAGVLRITKASRALSSSALKQQWEFSAPGVEVATWRDEVAWDDNRVLAGIRFVLHRTLLAACEQGRALAELSRSTFGYTVALATLTRGSLEAFARVNWVLSSSKADDLLLRHASLDYADLRYPEQHNLRVHKRHSQPLATVAVAEYRSAIVRFLDQNGLARAKTGPAELTTAMLDEVYSEGPELYSGLSAAAHGQGWATGNFFDVDQAELRRDDQMVIEYCAYVIEATILVSSKFESAFVAERASLERWASERDAVDQMLSTLLKRRDGR